MPRSCQIPRNHTAKQKPSPSIPAIEFILRQRKGYTQWWAKWLPFTFYLYLRPNRSTTKLYLLNKGIGSRGQLLLPSTFGEVEVEVEGMMFLYIESVKFHPLTSRSTKIDMEGRVFESYRHFTLVHNFAFFGTYFHNMFALFWAGIWCLATDFWVKTNKDCRGCTTRG